MKVKDEGQTIALCAATILHTHNAKSTADEVVDLAKQIVDRVKKLPESPGP